MYENPGMVFCYGHMYLFPGNRYIYISMYIYE